MPFYDGISDSIWTDQGRILVGSIGSSRRRICNWLILNARHKPMKVLLIDDNKEVTDAIADFFDTMEVNYKVIDEGRKTLSEILNQTEHYNVILLDIAIPQLSGHDILERLREKDGLIESKNIVLFTASTLTDNDIQKYLSLGIKEVLRKPMSLNDLTDVIQKYS
jgi:DNA-binding response OmpR family regulator